MKNVEKEIPKEEVQAAVGAARRVTSANFSFQFSTARESQEAEKKVFNILCEISKEDKKKSAKSGMLVVFGLFDTSKEHVVFSMRQIGMDSIQKYVDIANPSFRDDTSGLFSGRSDGAMISDRGEHMVGGKAYLIVDSLSLEASDGCGTRYIGPASFSERDDVIAVFTLSEETSVARTWRDGSFADKIDPEDE